MSWLVFKDTADKMNDTHRLESECSTDSRKMAKCSLCGVPFYRDQSPCVPFCSTRCQQIDLGHWLDENYGLPYEDDQLDPFEPSE